MKEIHLQFPSLRSLIDFSIVTRGENCHLNLLRLTMACCLSAHDIQLALDQYGAEILELGMA